MKTELKFRILNWLCLILFFFQFHSVLFASHAEGADVTYKCLGGNTYEITLTFYRDCAGVAAPTNAPITISSVSCGKTLNLTLVRIIGTGQEVTPVCNSVTSQCSGGNYPGVQEYVYTGIITLPNQCMDWVFGYSLCCLNNAIGTIATPGSQNLYVEAKLNNFNFPCNSSPAFSNRPIPFVCVGQPFCFNNGTTDIDGDSLSYSLITPQNGATSTVTYIAPYSASQPIASSPPVSFNQQTGEFCITPAQLQVTVFAVLVKEWRGGVFVGSVERNFQLRTISCLNNNPYINGINNTGQYTITACAGVPLNFTISSYDADAAQNVTLTWNNAITGASFATGAGSRPTASFSWTPTTADISNGIHCFTVTVKDNNCPFLGSQTFSFCITVTGFTISTTTASATCINNNGIATVVTSGGTPPFTYSWSPSGGTSATAIGVSAGSYSVIVKDANNCQQTETAVISTVGSITSTFSQSANQCLNGNSFSFFNTGTSTIGTTYQWSFSGPGALPPASNSQNLSGITFSTSGTYTVTHTSTLGACISTSINTVVVYPNPTNVAITSISSSCGNNNGAASIGTVIGGTAPYAFSFNGNVFSTVTTFLNLFEGTYPVVVQDANGCTLNSSAIVNSNLPPTNVILTSINSTCGNSNGSLLIGMVTGGTAPYTYSVNSGAFSNLTNYTGLAAGTGSVTIKDANGCLFTKPLIITNAPGPTSLAISYTAATCGNTNGTINCGAVTGGTAPFSYSFNGGAFNGISSYTSLGSNNYPVIVKDANGCSFATSIAVPNSTGPSGMVVNSTPSACASPTGSLSLGLVTGGAAPFTYSINNGIYATATNYFGLSAGVYSVSVKDANSCQYNTMISITNFPSPTAVVTTSANSTCGNANGGFGIGLVTGGSGPYLYNFNSLGYSATANYSGLLAGNYPLIVKDAYGCTYSTPVAIDNTPGPTAMITSSIAASCGNNNGGISIGAITGGTSPFTYSIGGSFSGTTNYSALPTGLYTITVKDYNACIYSVNFNIPNNNGLTASVTSHINVSCNGGNNGSVSVLGGNSSLPYSYSINGIDFHSIGTFNGLPAGSYTVIVKDGYGCTVNVPVSIFEPPVLTVYGASKINNVCYGGSSGSITIGGAGGTQPYTYSWNGGVFQTNGTFSGLVAGSYIVTMKDANGCFVLEPVNISQPSEMMLIPSSSNSICLASNGSATVSVTGGTPSYSYAWSPAGGNASTTSGLVSGTYTVFVTDANGCNKFTDAVIGNSAGGVASIGTFSNVTCNGANNGSVHVSMGGNSTAPYTYVWAPNVGSTAVVNNLSPNLYTVTVTDANGCVSKDSQLVTQPSAMALSATYTNVSCNSGSDGTATATIAGGTSPYTYLWLPGGFNTASVTGLNTGNYSVTVSDAKNCTTSTVASITQPVILNIGNVHIDANCGQSDGSATVTGSGGLPPYTWLWSNGQTNSSVSNLSAGTYIVTITDASQCSKNEPLTIANLSGPAASIVASSNVSCFGQSDGNATITISGGAPPFSYLWNNGQTSPTAYNLAAGIYSVIATDANHCSATANVTITQPPLLVANATGTNPVCFGNSNGTALASAIGGTLPYTYSWSSAGYPSTANISGLAAGVYSVSIMDSKGCSQAASVSLINPQAVLTSLTKTNTLCAGSCNGTATANVLNGFAPYLYSWNTLPNQTAATATGLCAGNYIVSVTDAHGCASQASTTIGSPPAITSALLSSGNATCYGASDGYAQISANGGTPPYSYYWMPNAVAGATATGLSSFAYTCTATDAHGCTTTEPVFISQPQALTANTSGSNITCYNSNDGTAFVNYSGGTAPYTFLWTPSLQTTFNPVNLNAGMHSVSVTDANGCTASSNLILTQPNPLIVATNPVSSNCGQSNGSACAMVTGGLAPYTYQWNNPSATTTACVNGLLGGTYNVTVADAGGCSATINANINDISAPEVNITSHTDVSCNGFADGTASANITGGVMPYSLHWTNGGQTVPNPINLLAGINTLTVTDAAGCVSSASVNILQPYEINTAVSGIVNASCNGQCNGSSTVLAIGGTPPLSFHWNDPNNQTTSNASNLCAGNYSVTITDANGCFKQETVLITQPAPLIIQSSVVTNIRCNGNNDGAISAVITGGTPYYTLNWQPNVSTAPTATGLSPGSYTLNVGDTKGCLTTANWMITDPVALTVVSSINFASCSSNNGIAAVIPSGGSGSYTYHWNDPNLQSTSIALNLFAGTYNCVVTDANNCEQIASVLIPNQPGPLIDSIVSTLVLCNGGNTGTATVYPKSGTGTLPLSFLWSPTGQTTASAVGLNQGTHHVLITDANGCSVTVPKTIVQPPPLILFVSPVDTICYGDTAQIYAQASGGNPAYTYAWTNASGISLSGSGPHLVIPQATAAYGVSVIDAKGCVSPASLNTSVFVHSPATLVASDKIICNGDSCIIKAIPSGGTGGPYSFQWSNGSIAQSQKVSPSLASSPVNYIVTVNDGCSKPATDTATVTVSPLSLGLVVPSDTMGCKPLLVNFSGTSNNGVTYNWDFGDSYTGTGANPSHTYMEDGVYQVTLTIITAQGCSTQISGEKNIVVNPIPVANFLANPNPVSVITPIVSFTDLSTPAISWNWHFNDFMSTQNFSSVQNPEHSFSEEGVYNVQLNVANKFGCMDSTIQKIEVKPDFVFYIPNAFTPNLDGGNEVFIPKGIGFDVSNYTFFVFDRWGNLVFSSEDASIGWDGKANNGKDVAQQDVYVWTIQFTDVLGKKHRYFGHVALIK